MDIIIVIGFCIAAVCACKIIEKTGSEIKIFMVFAAMAVIFLKTSSSLSSIFAQIKYLFSQGSIDEQYIKILFKGLGICYITKFACDYCRDCGENAIAGQAELAGKIALLMISLPLFNVLINIVSSLLF